MPQGTSSGSRGGIWSSRTSLSDDRWRRWSKHRYLVTRKSTWRPVFTSTRKPVVPHLQRCCPPVLPSLYRLCNRRDRKRKCMQCVIVFFECSRVATNCGLSSHYYFPRDITPPVKPVSLTKLNLLNVTGKFYRVTTFLQTRKKL